MIESVINNLSIPAFFFEVVLDETSSVEKNYVVDGQQRLTTLNEFSTNKLRLVDSQDAAYISPDSVHYAGKTFDELPQAYQQAFKKYRLTVIKLRNLGKMRLEVFRRINQGGTPLSGQDIRLAYYGGQSASIAFIRIVGVYDSNKFSGQRFRETTKASFNLDHPWTTEQGKEAWLEWWGDKDISRGQTASEMFLWSLASAQVETLDALLKNEDALRKIDCRFNRAIDEALDAYCAQLRYQDTNTSTPPILMTLADMKDKFFPAFEQWFGMLLAEKAPSLAVGKNRLVAAVIGAAYRAGINPATLSEQSWTNIVEFIRRPQPIAQKFGGEWPVSKGRWDGQRGYKAQLEAAYTIIKKLVQ